MIYNNSRKGISRSSKPLFNEINITPFVDIMLVLLIIFMITAPLLTSSIHVELPKINTNYSINNPNDSSIESIIISIDKDGNIYFGDDICSILNLISKLKDISKGKSPDNINIYIKGDYKLIYGRIMEVMNSIISSGFYKISLVSELNKNKNKI